MTETGVNPPQAPQLPSRGWIVRTPIWARVFVIGLLAWAITAGTAMTTNDTTLIPSVILIGSFLIPVTFLAWVLGRQKAAGRDSGITPTALTTDRVLTGFVLSGLFGLSLAAYLEIKLLATHPILFYGGVAVIEELLKLLLIILVGQGLAYYSRRDGMVLGAAIGFGFSAFESAGYAFNTIVESRSIEWHLLLETEMVRGLLSPVGHGLWSALVGGALFHAASKHHNRFRITGEVIVWYVVAVVLHVIWDTAAGIAVALTLWSTGEPASMRIVQNGRIPNPTQTQANLDQAFDWLLLGISSAVGIFLAVWPWRRGRAEAELLHQDSVR
ncbi:MAG: PrsW family glutamic-type intramembrane protease, partial [Actinomycetes bacterium]